MDNSNASSSDRYAGCPLLLILELFVMSCTRDMTDERKEDAKFACAPLIGPDNPFWKDKLVEKFGFSPKLEEHIRKMWVHRKSTLNLTNKDRLDLQPHLEKFSQEIVDANFSNLF